MVFSVLAISVAFVRVMRNLCKGFLLFHRHYFPEPKLSFYFHDTVVLLPKLYLLHLLLFISRTRFCYCFIAGNDVKLLWFLDIIMGKMFLSHRRIFLSVNKWKSLYGYLNFRCTNRTQITCSNPCSSGLLCEQWLCSFKHLVEQCLWGNTEILTRLATALNGHCTTV